MEKIKNAKNQDFIVYGGWGVGCIIYSFIWLSAGAVEWQL